MMFRIAKLQVSVARQEMTGFDELGNACYRTSISTASNGIGQEMGSECTPLGSHRIRAKVGAGQPLDAVFVGRRATGEVFSQGLAQEHPNRDWILTRILWLCGNQSGFNRGGSVDTQRRFIYIHGAPDFHQMGVPSSHGCIKMRNADIVQLFDAVDVGVEVEILSE